MSCPFCKGTGTIEVRAAVSAKVDGKQAIVAAPKEMPCPMGCKLAALAGVSQNDTLTGREMPAAKLLQRHRRRGRRASGATGGNQTDYTSDVVPVGVGDTMEERIANVYGFKHESE